MKTRLLAAAALLAMAAPAAAADFSPDGEAKNYSKINERFQHLTGTPEYQQQLREKGIQGRLELPGIIAADPDRASMLTNLCHSHEDGCAGDVRFWDWPDPAKGRLRTEPITWVARTGGIISGHVWVTSGGPAKKPGIVFTNGSVQAPEELYWPFAAALAEAGFVVLTWDPQTQGRSTGETQNYHLQDRTLFVEATQDALDFFFSNAGSPYHPRPEADRVSGASAPAPASGNFAGIQDDRVTKKLSSASNPFADRLDTSRVGLIGHSLGAGGITEVGNADTRVKAIVAYDNLGVPSTAIPARVPALGMSADYGLTPMPYTAAPAEQLKNEASNKYSQAGLDTGEITIRGGTHYEFSVIPNPGFGATYRGVDTAGWYALAWMEKYVKGDEDLGDTMLLTDRWQRDKAEGNVDPDKDGNVYSAYLKSRIDIKRADGSRARCEDLRQGCGILKPDSLPCFGVAEFAIGAAGACPGAAQTYNRALRSGSCATSVKAARKGRAGRKLKVKITLAQASKVSASLKRASKRKAQKAARAKTLKAGKRTLTVKLRKRLKAGSYRLKVRVSCPAGTDRKDLKVRIRR